MINFEYTARDLASGELVKSTIEAQNEAAAAKLLIEQGMAPTDIYLPGEKSLFSKKKTKVKTKEKILFFRQLSTLINAGLPLVQSLQTVAEQIDSRAFSIIVNKLISNVEAGNTFADSMKPFPKVFSNVVISLVAAGEASGTLDGALERIAFQTEKDAEIASKVKGALIYPAIVLFVILGVIVFMLTTVLPQVEVLYRDLNKDLPVMTAVMLSVSKLIINFWYIIIAVIFGGIIGLQKYGQTPQGHRFMDRVKLKVPLFGVLFKKLYMARFSRTGATLLSSGVQMLQMLQINADAVNNELVADDIRLAAEKVRGGKGLAESIKDSPNFLDLVPQMISIGEQSGSIGGMMEKSAEFYEKELDNQIKTISTTIEPVLMVVLAVVAGLMVGAILIPVYSLVGQNISV